MAVASAACYFSKSSTRANPDEDLLLPSFRAICRAEFLIYERAHEVGSAQLRQCKPHHHSRQAAPRLGRTMGGRAKLGPKARRKTKTGKKLDLSVGSRARTAVLERAAGPAALIEKDICPARSGLDDQEARSTSTVNIMSTHTGHCDDQPVRHASGSGRSTVRKRKVIQ